MYVLVLYTHVYVEYTSGHYVLILYISVTISEDVSVYPCAYVSEYRHYPKLMFHSKHTIRVVCEEGCFHYFHLQQRHPINPLRAAVGHEITHHVWGWDVAHLFGQKSQKTHRDAVLHEPVGGGGGGGQEEYVHT